MYLNFNPLFIHVIQYDPIVVNITENVLVSFLMKPKREGQRIFEPVRLTGSGVHLLHFCGSFKNYLLNLGRINTESRLRISYLLPVLLEIWQLSAEQCI